MGFKGSLKTLERILKEWALTTAPHNYKDVQASQLGARKQEQGRKIVLAPAGGKGPARPVDAELVVPSPPMVAPLARKEPSLPFSNYSDEASSTLASQTSCRSDRECSTIGRSSGSIIAPLHASQDNLDKARIAEAALVGRLAPHIEVYRQWHVGTSNPPMPLGEAMTHMATPITTSATAAQVQALLVECQSWGLTDLEQLLLRLHEEQRMAMEREQAAMHTLMEQLQTHQRDRAQYITSLKSEVAEGVRERATLVEQAAGLRERVAVLEGQLRANGRASEQ